MVSSDNKNKVSSIKYYFNEFIRNDARFHKYSIIETNNRKKSFELRLARYIECRTYTFHQSLNSCIDNTEDILDITHYETYWE